jgi:hypothetical protein
VLRPDGRLVVSSWTPDGSSGDMFATVGRYLPSEGDPSTLWGTEAHVRELLGDAVTFKRKALRFQWPSAEAAAVFYESSFGPMIVAREAVGDRWPALRADLVAMFEEHDVGAVDGIAYDAGYLQATYTGVPTSVLS